MSWSRGNLSLGGPPSSNIHFGGNPPPGCRGMVCLGDPIRRLTLEWVPLVPAGWGAQPPNSQDLGVCPGWAVLSLCQLLGAAPPGSKMLIPARSYVASRWISTLADPSRNRSSEQQSTPNPDQAREARSFPPTPRSRVPGC